MTKELGLTDHALELLARPLNLSAIKQREGGGGKKLKYLKGDTVIDSANEIFGYGGWGYRVVARGREEIEAAEGRSKMFYTADIELSVKGAEFSFPGDGIGIVTAPFTVEAHEKARKEATTDAIKRALRHYGDQFGLSLYDEDDYVDVGDGTQARVGDVQFKGKTAYVANGKANTDKSHQETQRTAQTSTVTNKTSANNQKPSSSSGDVPTQAALKKEFEEFGVKATDGTPVTWAMFVAKALEYKKTAQAATLLASRDLEYGECEKVNLLLQQYRNNVTQNTTNVA